MRGEREEREGKKGEGEREREKVIDVIIHGLYYSR
jgi:hypothetical protein